MASSPSFRKEIGALEVARTYAAQVEGKIVLITGVSKDGIGEATARAFAHAGAALIIITGRDDARLSSITKSLSTEYPLSRFRPHKLDLNSLKATRCSATEILEDNKIPGIDILIANAGGNFQNTTKELTVDGLETHFGVNHIGHFLCFTILLLKLLLATHTAMFMSPFRFSDYNFDKLLGVEPHEGYNHVIAYAQSKTANTLFATHINHLFSNEGISAFAVHPGGVQSRLTKKFLESITEEERGNLKIPFEKTIDQDAATTMVAALDPGLTLEKGVYLNDCRVADAPLFATSEEKAEKLWKLSETIIGDKLL